MARIDRPQVNTMTALMSRPLRLDIVWMLSVLLCVACGARPTARPTDATSTEVTGGVAPLDALRWPVLGPAGAETFDPGTLRGRWVLLHATTTTCAPCEAQFIEVQALAQRFELSWVLLLLDAHPERVAPRFAETWALDATLLLAPPEARAGQLPWGRVDALPEFWVVDPTGTVRAHFSGFLPSAQVEVLLGR